MPWFVGLFFSVGWAAVTPTRRATAGNIWHSSSPSSSAFKHLLSSSVLLTSPPVHFLTAAVCFFLMKSLTGASKGRCTEVRKRGEWCLPVFQVKIANTHICIHIGKAKQEGKSIALVKTHFQIWMKLVISRASQKPLFPDLISSLNVTLAASQKIGDEQDLQRSPNPSLCQTAPCAWDSPAAGNASSFFWLSAVWIRKMQRAAPAFFAEVTSPLKTRVPKGLQHKQDRLHSPTLIISSSAFPSSRGMGRVGRDDRVWGEVNSQIQSCLHNSSSFFSFLFF